MRALILIGVSGSGKSTYVKSLIESSTENIHVYNADNYRIKMFGSLEMGNTHHENGKRVDPSKQVFKALNEDLDEDLDNATDNDVFILDNMNLSRKHRRSFYEKFRSKHIPVEAHFFFASEETIDNNQSQRAAVSPGSYVKPYIIHDMVKTLQVPRLTVDCDEIICHGEKWFKKFRATEVNNLQELIDKVSNDNMKQTLTKNFAPHQCLPYHKESINEHIDMCIVNSWQSPHDPLLHEEAIFHDLGKAICKEFTDESKHKIMESALLGVVLDKNDLNELTAHYLGHANVSAVIYMNYMFSNDAFGADNYQVLEAIYQHMNAHTGMGKKNINVNKLDDKLLAQIEEFRKIDDKSRIVY